MSAHTRAAAVLEEHGHLEEFDYMELLPELPEVYRLWLNDDQEKDLSWSIMHLVPWQFTKDWRQNHQMVPRLTGKLNLVRGLRSPYRRGIGAGDGRVRTIKRG